MLEIFNILRSGERINPLNKNNCANFSGDKSTMNLSGEYIFWENTEQNEVKSGSRPRRRI